MCRVNERLRQLRVGVASSRVELGLGQEDAPGKVCSAEVRIPQIGSDQIGCPQVGTAKIGRDQVGSSQVGAPQVRATKIGSDEIGAPAYFDWPLRSLLLSARRAGAHKLADAQQQRVHFRPMRGDVQLLQRVGIEAGETLRLVEHTIQRIPQRPGRFQCQRFGQIREYLVKLPHDRKHFEHRLRVLRCLSPVDAAEGDLGNFLPRPEAIIDGASPEPPISKLGVNAAAEIRPQVAARLSGILVDREVRRSGERQRDAAQAEASLAVRQQVGATLILVSG